MQTLADLPPSIDPRVARTADRVLGTLQRYHRYRVVGMENIPAEGPALIVVHHSLATYDILLLGYSIFKQLGRAPRALADRLIFRTPKLSEWATGLGAVQGDPGAALRLLDEGNLVMVAPGGMREALRSSRQRYQTSWEGRLGFARLAIKANVPVIPAACPAADNIYTVYSSFITDFCLDRFHVPVPLVRGAGPSLLPRPSILTHYVGSPIPPPRRATITEGHVRAFADEIRGAVDALLRRRSMAC